MSIAVVLPALTSLLALVFALALLDQWLERRRGFQAIWALGMLFFAIGSACEAVGASLPADQQWPELLYRTWYLTGAVFTAAWLGLGTAYLLGKTRFGYAYAVLVFFGGFLAFVARNTYDAGTIGVLVVHRGARDHDRDCRRDVLPERALAEHRGTDRRGGQLRWCVLRVHGSASPGHLAGRRRRADRCRDHRSRAHHLAVHERARRHRARSWARCSRAYIFMPKKRVLDYSLDAGQSGDQFLFNMLPGPSPSRSTSSPRCPARSRPCSRGKIHSRVPATLLIAIGGIVVSSADALVPPGLDHVLLGRQARRRWS